MNLKPQPRPHLEKIGKYSAGKSAEDFQKRGKSFPVKLSSNEATWGPSPQAVDALKREASRAHLYPDSQPLKLREALADFTGLTPDHVVLGNGSNEVIQFALQAYVAPSEHILVPELTFSMYRIYSQMMNIRVRGVPNREDFGIDLNAFRKKITSRTKMIFLASPNNPTGMILDKMELELFLMGLNKRILVVMDEAYADFCDPALKPDFTKMILNGKYPNLLVLRTFSKAFGLAGLRAGYGLGDPGMISHLRRMGQHFNLNRFAIAAALASLENQGHYRKIVEKTKLGRDYLQREFSRNGILYTPSQANFIMIYAGNGSETFERLGQKGFIVRELHSFGLPEHLRVTVSSMEDNREFLKVLKEVTANR